MQIPIYQIDAFTSKPFGGNPAAVCPLVEWLPDSVLASIAAENNLSETAFLKGGAGRYEIRWFTPAVEVELCGHATLASAFAVFQFLEPSLGKVIFDSRSGPLTVTKEGDRLSMDFPARPAVLAEPPMSLAKALGAAPKETLKAKEDWLAVFETEGEVRGLNPDFRLLRELGVRGAIVTAAGSDADFVSRFFAPGAGIDEDPVTGSAHCTLAPYWSNRLGKTSLFARQVSRRGGEVWCTHRGARVELSGQAVLYLTGTIGV
jgi:PhzF family phenazine biosynthesis protein